jgi:hypothetical protein
MEFQPRASSFVMIGEAKLGVPGLYSLLGFQYLSKEPSWLARLCGSTGLTKTASAQDGFSFVTLSSAHHTTILACGWMAWIRSAMHASL